MFVYTTLAARHLVTARLQLSVAHSPVFFTKALRTNRRTAGLAWLKRPANFDRFRLAVESGLF